MLTPTANPQWRERRKPGSIIAPIDPPPSLVHLVRLCSALSLLRGSHFLFLLKEELWQLTQRGAPLLYGVCSPSLVPVPLVRPSNGMISSCMASLPQPSSRNSSSQRSIRSLGPSWHSRPTLWVFLHVPSGVPSLAGLVIAL